MAIGLAKPIPIKPTGLMDYRSDPSDISVANGLATMRLLLNFNVEEEGKPRRSSGWRKLFGESEFGFNNQDLHEQLIDQQSYYSEYDTTYYNADDGYYDFVYCGTYLQHRNGCREAILHLHEMASETGTRKLIAFTQKRIYELNERGGNYRLLADGLGSPVRNLDDETCQPCAGPRWQTAQLLGYLIATNGVDPVMSYKLGDAPDGCNLWSFKPIQELLDVGITRAGAVAEFKGFILIGDVDQDGARRPGRVFWSDFNAPRSWLPLPGTSLSGFLDVGFSEKVLRMEPMGDYLMIYTDAGVKRLQFSLVIDPVTQIAQQVFNCTDINPNSNKVLHPLRYQYSLVNTGTEHLYAASDGIYVLDSPFASAPRRIEWIHKATGIIYTGATRWDEELQRLPDAVSASVQFGALNKKACDAFYGFYNPLTKEVWWTWASDTEECANVSIRINLQYAAASLVDHGFSAFGVFRSDTRPTFNQWLESIDVCLATDFQTMKEGEMQGQSTALVDQPPYIWNAEEDPNGVIEPDSLCARIGDVTLADICEGCEGDPIFIGASTQDFTLKEFSDEIFYREMFASGDTYTRDGYPSLIQSGAMNFNTSVEKAFHNLTVEFKALEQTTPSLLYAMIGFGPQASCPMWENVGARELKCLTARTLAQHDAKNTRPDLRAQFPHYFRGVFGFFRLFVTGTGGGFSLDRTDLTVRNAQS